MEEMRKFRQIYKDSEIVNLEQKPFVIHANQQFEMIMEKSTQRDEKNAIEKRSNNFIR